MLLICGGDLGQFEALKKGTMRMYLLKLDSYVRGIESQMKVGKSPLVHAPVKGVPIKKK